MKKGWTGLESAGKSQLMAVEFKNILKRNIRWIKIRRDLGLPFIPRTMATDTPMSTKLIEEIQANGMRYLHFYNLSQLMSLSQVDIFINEINKFFPQRGNEPLTREQAEFLSQGAKDGVDIYFCSQDFSQAHKQFRFLVNEIYLVRKIIGSRRPVASAPPVNRIWGLVCYWPVDARSFDGSNESMVYLDNIPSFYFINKEDTELYDTSYKVRGSEPPPIIMVEQEFQFFKNNMQVKTLKKWVKR